MFSELWIIQDIYIIYGEGKPQFKSFLFYYPIYIGGVMLKRINAINVLLIGIIIVFSMFNNFLYGQIESNKSIAKTSTSKSFAFFTENTSLKPTQQNVNVITRRMRIYQDAWGWWTGHYFLMDSLVIYNNGIVFEDNFDDNYLDPSQWTSAGNTVLEQGEIMQILTNQTDYGGYVDSRWIDIDPNYPLIIERKCKAHYSIEYHISHFNIKWENDPAMNFGVNYGNMIYSDYYLYPVIGTALFRYSHSPHQINDTSFVSYNHPIIWDEWFKEKIEYYPNTGYMNYYVNNLLITTYYVGKLTNDPGLVAYYDFNNDNLDKSGLDNNGTTNGNIIFTTDRFGNQNSAIYLDGQESFINVPNSVSLESPRYWLTITGWIKFETDHPIVSGLIQKSDDAEFGQYGLSIQHWDNNKLFANFKDGYGYGVEYPFLSNTWYFIAIVYTSNNSIKLFVNNELVGEVIPNFEIIHDSKPLSIGRETPGDVEYLKGYLDDIRVYNKALTEDEIAELYHENGWTQGNITILEPNGGENWQVEGTYDISWSSTGVSEVKIDYTTNNGVSWLPIAASKPNDGSYSWTIPNTPSDECRIRISDVSNPTLQDESDGLFSINLQSINLTFTSKYRNSIITLPAGLNTPVKICADGSDATNIKISAVGIADRMGVRIVEGTSPDEYGSFEMEIQNPDIAICTYTHPRIISSVGFLRSLTLVVYDIISGTIHETQTLQIFRAPVIMVHGIWANSSSFEGLMSAIAYGWPTVLRKIYDYETTNSEHFLTNLNPLSLAIINVIGDARKNNFSVAKTNVVTHSMGGLLTRMFIQSDFYKDDICRFIALNGPHSGSQMANLIIHNLSPDIRFWLKLIGLDSFGGAVEDLQVDNEVVDNLLNGQNLNLHTAPTHIISTTFNDASILNNSWDIMILNLASKILRTPIEILVAGVFNQDNNDLIVAEESQKGGVYTLTENNNQWHVGSANNLDNIATIDALLNDDFSDVSVFSHLGFNPPDLFYLQPNFPVLSVEKNNNIDSIFIISPTPNDSILVGQILNVLIGSTSGIQEIFLSSGNPSVDVYWEFKETTGSPNTFTYTIPMDAYGKYGLFALGFADSVLIDLDTLNINVITTSLIDSISFQVDTLKVLGNDGISPLTIVGYFDDGIRRMLGNANDLILETGDPTIASVELPGIITGHLAGQTTINALFRGKTTSASVVVLPSNYLTGINHNDDNDTHQKYIIPLTPSLGQNYPNPFNPSTVINYQLSFAGNVTLKVYDVLGKEVSTLVNEEKPIGNYEVEFNASHLASGIYFYKIQAGDFVQTKKMILLK